MDIEFDISFCLVGSLEIEELRGFLAAVEQHSGPVAYEVLVAGSAINPASPLCRDLRLDFPQLVLLEPGREQPGATCWGRLLNPALARAQGRYLAPWSSRVHPLAGCLQTLVEFLDEETETAVAAPRLVDPAGHTLPSARRLPGLSTILLLHSLLGKSGLGGPILKRYCYAEQPPVLNQAPREFLSGRALLIRRAAWEEVGFFDEGFHTLYADADYCRRALALGWHCRYLAGAVAREHEPERHRPDYLLTQPQPGQLADATRLLLKKWWRL